MNGKEMNQVLNHQARLMDKMAQRIIGSFARIFGALAARNEEFFFYQIQVTLDDPIGSQVQGTVNITQEADFVLQKIMQVTYDATTGVPDANPSWEAQIYDGSTDRALQNAPIHVSNLAGTAQRPLIVPKNRLFRRNSTIRADFTQIEDPGANDQIIQLNFLGYKVFDADALDLTTRR
jgi:hypothetical protein